MHDMQGDLANPIVFGFGLGRLCVIRAGALPWVTSVCESLEISRAAPFFREDERRDYSRRHCCKIDYSGSRYHLVDVSLRPMAYQPRTYTKQSRGTAGCRRNGVGASRKCRSIPSTTESLIMY